MKEFQLFLLLMIPSLVGLIFLLKKVFKNSMLFTFGIIWVVCQSILVIEAYGIGKLGDLYDFAWAFPLGIGFSIVGMVYLSKQYKKALIDTSTNIIKLSTGDLHIELDEKLFKRKDEVGMIANALHTMIEELRGVAGGVQTGADSVLSAGLQLSSASEQLSQGASFFFRGNILNHGGNCE